jgi:hypothetical protein
MTGGSQHLVQHAPLERRTVNGAFSLVLRTTQLPAAMAGATFLLKNTNGAYSTGILASTQSEAQKLISSKTYVPWYDDANNSKRLPETHIQVPRRIETCVPLRIRGLCKVAPVHVSVVRVKVAIDRTAHGNGIKICQFVARRQCLFGHFPQRFATLGRGHRAPCREGCLGGGDGGVDIFD